MFWLRLIGIELSFFLKLQIEGLVLVVKVLAKSGRWNFSDFILKYLRNGEPLFLQNEQKKHQFILPLLSVAYVGGQFLHLPFSLFDYFIASILLVLFYFTNFLNKSIYFILTLIYFLV